MENPVRMNFEEKKNAYDKRAVYIPYWSVETYGPGLGVFVFIFDPDVAVELVWCDEPCKAHNVENKKLNRKMALLVCLTVKLRIKIYVFAFYL